MDKAELDQFIEYYHEYEYEYNVHADIISHMYEHFGREFIHRIPIERKTDGFGYRISVIESTHLRHSVTEPAYFVSNSQPRFYILGYYMTLDDWLPRSALSSEEQIMFKLKYG